MSFVCGVVLAYGRRKQKFTVDIMAHAIAMSILSSCWIPSCY